MAKEDIREEENGGCIIGSLKTSIGTVYIERGSMARKGGSLTHVHRYYLRIAAV